MKIFCGKKAFTLVELMIVVSILGILGAIVLPMFQDHIQKAKEAAAKDNLRILRNVINQYAAQHTDVPPGYANDNPSLTVMGIYVYRQLAENNQYLSALPENPFNESSVITALRNDQTFPSEADDASGWIYKPSTKEIRLNQSGVDSEGTSYFSY